MLRVTDIVQNSCNSLSIEEWETGTVTGPGVKTNGMVMRRLNSAYFSRLQGGKWSDWTQMESIGQSETTLILKIYAYGGVIRLSVNKNSI